MSNFQLGTVSGTFLFLSTLGCISPANAASVASPQVVKLVAIGSNLCVDVPGASKAQALQLQQYACNGTGAQAYTLSQNSDRSYTFANLNSGLCLESRGSSSAIGGAVDQNICGGASNQSWNAASTGNGQYKLTVVSSGLCLDVPGNSTASKALLEQWSCNGGSNQSFQIINTATGADALASIPAAISGTTVSSSGPTAVPIQSDSAVSGMSVDATGASFDWGYVLQGGTLDYPLNVIQAGTYQLTLHDASPSGSTGVNVLVNGTKAAAVSFGATGSWQTYTDASAVAITLPAGAVTLELQAQNSGFNLAGISLTPGTAATSNPPAGNGLGGAYTDPKYLTSIPFGSQSEWIQPWRAYLDTQPASVFINGMGMAFDTSNNQNPNLVAQMLASHGITHARIEIEWGELDYATESVFPNDQNFKAKIQACKTWGIRPLILLNAHQGAPTPLLNYSRTVTADAAVGATQVQLNDVSGLIVGRSGFSNLTDDWAAEALITSISGSTVTLSKPLPKAFSAGSNVPMATLKHRPFSQPGSSDYLETIAGWQHYVDTIETYMANVMGNSGAADKGFDLEIWNELTFGSHFLNINDYYQPALVSFSSDTIWQNLVKATADEADAHANDFAGVQITDGFANTIPWPASSTEPSRINAISKHPYPPKLSLPSQQPGGTAVNALLQVDTSGYKPTYTAFFPEYLATAIQTETLVRDMAPITNDIYGTNHGRNARVINGQVNPVTMWMTEVNILPSDAGITDPTAAQAFKGKNAARFDSFFLNKGFSQVDLFTAANGGDLGFALLSSNFLTYVQNSNVYPVPDTQYVSPTLAISGRISSAMKDQLDTSLTPATTRALQLLSITDTHNHAQFTGDGTAAHPPLYDRDVFAFLPYQVNAHRFVIPYYVMTRDVSQSLPAEDFSLSIGGINGVGATVSAYNPVDDSVVQVSVDGASSSLLNVTLPASDVPYLLIVQEAGS